MTLVIPPPQEVTQAIEHAFCLAVAQQQQGRTQQADELYRMILQLDPVHAPSKHNLGLMAMQAQQTEEALGYFQAALDADPTQGQFWLSYIDALVQTGQADVARQVLEQSLQRGLQGEQVESLKALLGVAGRRLGSPQIALQHPVRKSGNVPESKELKKLEVDFNKGRYVEVVARARSQTHRYPQHGGGWKMLGAALIQLGRYEEALPAMQKAVATSQSDAEVHNLFGIALRESGSLDEAATSFRRAIQLKPGFTKAHCNLGVALHYAGRRAEAVECYRKALEIDPTCDDALSNLGVILHDAGNLQGAEASYRQALRINPNNVSAHSNLGITLKSLGKLDDAEASYRRALEIKPDFLDGYFNLGGILHDMGRLDEAEASYRRLLELCPHHAAAYSSLLFCRSQRISVEAEGLFAEHCLFGERFEAQHRDGWGRFINTKDPERVLKVGFVSGDFRDHAIAYFIEPILAHLVGCPDLSLYAYYNHEVEDAITQRLRRHFRYWYPVSAMSEDALVERIRADEIDILIDLSGHTFKNRLLTFARKPAPIQASWMGYPGTTGMRSMDYYLTDKFFLPLGLLEKQFTEKAVRLPASVSFLPNENAPLVNALPFLSNGHITFGSFNRPSKLSREVIALWSSLLRALPDSKMVMGAIPEDSKNVLTEWFSQEGIAQERLSFYPFCSMDVYLGLHHQVDICLDTFPYNGGTTTLHALWMGVPTLTLSGATAAGRSGVSILGNVGLEAFVATDAEDFVRKGLSWAKDPMALSDIRGSLRGRLSSSALGQPTEIADGVVRALRIMWRRWCAGGTAQSFEVNNLDSITAMQEIGK
ncbi:MAG: tetratricopeptide repeat protein [Sideroxydans sp.]|nr:tetratricopeptide repeat protein [Sideroxydans sp.]